MVELSVVVPAYRVQGYLERCLDSILAGPYDDIEVVAIDDASPDHCGAIMDRYADRDTRVRVLHLAENQGLGAARNIGLREAKGDYLWFVDSDDWLAPGAIEAVVARLRETVPDVLIVDYARVYWTGTAQRNSLAHLFAEPADGGVFTLAEHRWPLYNMMTIWNRVVRREFLLDLDLAFGTGYYEDVQVSYPILLGARRIAALDRVCYLYRQRRQGGITRTPSGRHFAAFDAYARIFGFMDDHAGAFDAFRPDIFDRMMWHYVIILGRRRVPDGRRREFFRRMSEHYLRYRPAGHPPPDGTEGLRYRLIERGAYRTFVLARLANRIRRGTIRSVRGAVRRCRRWTSRVRGATLRGYYRVQVRLPLDEHLAVYAAYWYRGYYCNPRAIHRKAAELVPQVRGVWVVSARYADRFPAEVPHVIAGTAAYYRALARAKYLVNNVNFPDWLVKRRGSVHLQTQHGTPLKVMGLDLQDYPVGAQRMSFRALLARSDRWDFNLSSNPLSTRVWERSYPCGYTTLESGYPRNDRLVNATAGEVARVRAELGIAPGQTAVLYAPTHRDYRKHFEPQLDLAGLARALGPDAVLLVRAHYYYDVPGRGGVADAGDAVRDVSGYPSIEDLMVAADVLITDYSSLMFDYALLGRPIVIYADDWDTYRRTRGVNLDLPAEPPGAVAGTESELIELLTTGAYRGEQAEQARLAFRAKHCVFDDGHAAERVVRRVFGA